MVFSISTLEPRQLLHFSPLSQPNNLTLTHLNPFLVKFPSTRPKLSLQICSATKSETSSSSASNSKKKKKKRGGKSGGEKLVDLREVEIIKSDEFIGDDEDDEYGDIESSKRSSISTHSTTPLPKPPAGFVVDETGKLLLASNKRLATIIDSSNNNPLECVIRRIVRSSRGDECLLLCPVDTPVQILKSTNIEGWSAVSDEEVEAILPAAAYALAKIHMHLVHSGFCYTARGGFCYSEDDIFDFRTDDGQDVEGLPAEGVEVTSFNQDGGHYMIYTPSDPLLFVAVKDENGVLRIADDELLDDPAIISAIDEETEFNALVEEEAALLDSLMGKT